MFTIASTTTVMTGLFTTKVMKYHNYTFYGGSRDGDERKMLSFAVGSEVKYPLRSFNPTRCYSDSVKKVDQRFEVYRCEDEYTLVYIRIEVN